VIATGQRQGMLTLEGSIQALVTAGIVGAEFAAPAQTRPGTT